MDLLKGIRAVDLTAAASGTSGTMVLADLGADMIKIEPPRGEHYRYAIDGAFLLALNRNKRDFALDLRTAEGQGIALRLASQADVLMENFVPGTIDRLGLGYDKVSQLNPDIIYCSERKTTVWNTQRQIRRPMLYPLSYRRNISGVSGGI